MRLKHTSCLAVAFALSACGRPPQVAPDATVPADVHVYSSTPQGLAVSDSADGTTIIFLGYRQDILSQLQESLSGVQKDELWYRFHVPTELMPSRSTETKFQLHDTHGITVVIRKLYGLPGGYETLSFASANAGVTGSLKITGADLVVLHDPAVSPDGQQWGITLVLRYTGPLTVGSVFVPSVDFNYSIGALFRMPIP